MIREGGLLFLRKIRVNIQQSTSDFSPTGDSEDCRLNIQPRSLGTNIHMFVHKTLITISNAYLAIRCCL